MAWQLSEKEYGSVRSLEAGRRYEYFISRIVDTEHVWGLSSREGDWAFATDDDGTEVMAVWPHERYAASCADGPWAEDEPRPISLDDWLARWLPGLERDGHEIAVFPTGEDTGVRVTAQRLRDDLNEGLKQY
jgi:hypothetical protein